MQIQNFGESEKFRFLHNSLSKLLKKLRVGGKDFICDAFEFFTYLSRGFQLVNISNDLSLLLARELSNLLNNFICAHDDNLPIFSDTSKLCGKTTSKGFHAIFGVSFGVGLPGRAGVSVSGW